MSKSNGDMPASPTKDYHYDATGLTKREMFAMAAHASLLSSKWDLIRASSAKNAVLEADKLLEELAK